MIPGRTVGAKQRIVCPCAVVSCRAVERQAAYEVAAENDALNARASFGGSSSNTKYSAG